MATSAAVPCWNRPITSRAAAGLWLSKVAPDDDSHHSPAMKWRKVGGCWSGAAERAGAAVSVMDEIYTGNRQMSGTDHAAANGRFSPRNRAEVHPDPSRSDPGRGR